MANEATVINYPKSYMATDFTVADGTGIEKGTILKISGSRTVAAASADNDIVAGIAAAEKIASDGRTQLAVYRSGIFDCRIEGSVTVGQDVTISGANTLKAYTTLDGEKGAVLGKALEAVTGTGNAHIQLNLE